MDFCSLLLTSNSKRATILFLGYFNDLALNFSGRGICILWWMLGVGPGPTTVAHAHIISHIFVYKMYILLVYLYATPLGGLQDNNKDLSSQATIK